MGVTKIEWTATRRPDGTVTPGYTFNPWIGCSKVSDSCKNCYAEEMMDKRYGRAKWGDAGTRVRTSEANWKKPLQWDKAAAAAGERHRVFCASLADVFEDRPELEPWRDDLFRLITDTPNLDWLLLTKRPENAHAMMLAALDEIGYTGPWPLPNVWTGTSVENQEQADKRIPELLKIPAKVRFLSMEPLLGPVDLSGRQELRSDSPHSNEWRDWLRSKICSESPTHGYREFDTTGIDWVIVGGESGRNARPMHPDWARSLRDQCQAAGVPYFFKQWGEFVEEFLTESGLACMTRVGKHAAGRELDGRTWDETPT